MMRNAPSPDERPRLLRRLALDQLLLSRREPALVPVGGDSSLGDREPGAGSFLSDEGMTSIAPSFRALFEAAPGSYLVITTDFTIVAVSEAYLRDTMTIRAEITGRGLFEVFPDNPADSAATGVDTLRASLVRVLSERKSDTMAVQKFDIRRPASDGGGFEERHWSLTNSPVLDAAGEVAWIIHAVSDVTDFVMIHQQGTAQVKETETLRTRTQEMERDIVERAQDLQEANAHLRASQSSLAEAQAISHVGSFEWDIETGAIIWSDEQFRIFGYEPGSVETDYKLFTDAVHSDDRPWVDTAYKRCVTSGEPFDAEFRIVRSDGVVRWIHQRGLVSFDNGSPVRLVGSTPVHLIGTTEDITDRRKSDAERSANEQNFRQLADAMPQIVWTAHAGGDVDYCNQRWYDYTGMTAEQTKVSGWKPAIHADDLDDCVEEWTNSIKAGEPYEVEYRFERADGAYRWHLGRAIPVRDTGGRITKWFGTWTDINDHKLAEEALRASELLFKRAFQDAHIGMALVSLDSRYIEVNDIFCETVGYERDELIGMPFARISHPEDRVQNEALRVERLEGPRDSIHVSKRYIHKNGDVVWAEESASLVRDTGGEPLYFVSQIQDVTASKFADEERTTLERQLRQAHKMEAVGQLAGGVAHDFNNILAVILNYAEFVTETLDEDHEGHSDLKQIVKAGERGAELVHQLLAFSRQEIIQPSVIDLNEVIAGMAMFLARSVGEEIELNIETPSGLSLTKADHGQIEQILLNLVVNARDSMPDGGRIEIATGNVDLEAGVRMGLPAGHYVCLTVTDTGTGIDAENLDHIFEPFFTTKARGDGTGLGLATVYGIVKQAHGGIYADSEMGVMTSFAVYLPVTDEEVRAPVAHTAIEADDEATILVVEDEDPVRELIVRILRREGFEVIDVASGAEAVEICSARKSKIDLLLTDVVMPKMSGPALRDVVLPLRPEMRVLFMSGYTDELIAKRGVLDVGEALINKPFNSGQLLARVREVLNFEEGVRYESN